MLGRMTFAALLIAAPGAMAFEATLGSVSVNLPPPRGFCELSTGNATDKEMLATVGNLLAGSGHRLLGMSADCRQLADWRAGKRRLLDDHAQYQTSTATLDRPPPESVAQTCAGLRAEGDKIVSNQTPDMKARIESTLKKVKLNQMGFIGVLGEDPEACYAGLAQKIHTEAGTDKTQLAVFATTIIKDRLVLLYEFTVYVNAGTVKSLLAKLKIDAAALIAANRN
jgi:hypothetical protein